MGFKPKKKMQEDLDEVEEEEIEEEELEAPKPVPTPKSEWSVEEVPTATQPVIYNSKEKKAYSLLDAVAELLRRTE